MRLLAFDGRMGGSGDMLLGALLAAGADRDALDLVEAALDVSYRVESTTKNGIAATTVDVRLGGRRGSRSDDSGNEHEHHHAQHEHNHAHVDHGDDSHAEGAGPSRTYLEVVSIVESMDLPEEAESDALSVFSILVEAEAAVHGTDIEETHFHEVGADDAIADVVGVSLLIAELGPDRIVTTPLSTGGGEVEMSHGCYPVPPPAVVKIAERADWEISGGPVDSELLTPTGAAILAHFAEGVDSLPSLSVSASGYGAGKKDFPEHPNVLRALVGAGKGSLVRDDIAVLETNLDDASPELLGGLQETLFEAGARDVSVLPATMKKSRPGHLVKVVVKPEDAERVARQLAEETGTLGVRQTGASHRLIAKRRFVTTTLDVNGERHEVAVKVARTDDGDAYDVSAEYDDAAAVARETDLAIREIMRRAEAAARDGGALSSRLVHVVESERWRTFERTSSYITPSLDEEGFIHLSTPKRVLGVAQYNYPDAAGPLLLVVDRELIEDDLKYEETTTGAFPHLYDELDTAAIVDIFELPVEDGRYVLPSELREE